MYTTMRLTSPGVSWKCGCFNTWNLFGPIGALIQIWNDQHDWWVMTGRFGAGVEQRKVGHDEHLRDIPAGWWCPVVCALGSRLEDESSFGCTAWSHLICCLLFVEPCSRLSYDVFSSTGGERYKTSESWWILYGCSFGVAWKVVSPKIQPSSIATRR